MSAGSTGQQSCKRHGGAQEYPGIAEDLLPILRMEGRKTGQKTKMPYNPANGERAKIDDLHTFADFRTTLVACEMGGYDGIGAFDIDKCIREDGTLNDTAATVLSIFPAAYVRDRSSRLCQLQASGITEGEIDAVNNYGTSDSQRNEQDTEFAARVGRDAKSQYCANESCFCGFRFTLNTAKIIRT